MGSWEADGWAGREGRGAARLQRVVWAWSGASAKGDHPAF